MKPVLKSFDIATEHNSWDCVRDVLLVLSSMCLLALSVVACIKFISRHCCQRYEYKYDCRYNNKHDNNCNCGCNDDDSDNCCDCE